MVWFLVFMFLLLTVTMAYAVHETDKFLSELRRQVPREKIAKALNEALHGL